MSQRSRNPERARKGRRGWTHQSRAISEKIAERLREAEQQASPTEPVNEETEDGSGCQLTWTAASAEHKCSRGTYGCILTHDGDDKIPVDEPELSYAEFMKEWNAQVKAGKSKGHQRQD